MRIKWQVQGEEGCWFARAENEYTYAEARADNLFEAMEKAEEELMEKTEELLRKAQDGVN